MPQPARPTDELLEELEKLIAYRMERTGEDREQVCSHFVNYIKKQYNDLTSNLLRHWRRAFGWRTRCLLPYRLYACFAEY